MCSIGDLEPTVTVLEWFYIRSKLNGFVLEETGQEQPIVVSPEAGRDGQLWKWEGDSLVSKNNLALDMIGPIDDDWNNGAGLIAWPPHNGVNQIWKFEDDLIVDLGGTNFGLEIEDSMPTQGTRVIAKNIKGNQEQFWSLDCIAGDI